MMPKTPAFSFAPAASLASSRTAWLRQGTHFCCTTNSRLAKRKGIQRARIFRTLNNAPTMLFDTLADRMSDTVRKMRGVDKITDKNVAGAMKEVKRALLDADVNLRVVNSLLKEIKTRALGADVVPGVDPGQMLVKIMHEELTNIMGKGQAALNQRRESDGPTVILLAGLQGAGKTTAAAKLALYCVKEGRSVLLIASDVYRPAAIDQLKKLGAMIDVDVFSMGRNTDPKEIVRKGIEQANKDNINTVIVDTAGRQVVDMKLMKELKDIKKISAADETLLVVDAMTGQEAASLTRAFNDEVSITGAILTKMDGDTRGGAALSVQQVSGCPIKFIGVGEKVEKLEPFYPERMASRILGMGDVLTFVEKAKDVMDQKDAEKMTKKMMDAKFDFDDFLKQTKMVSTMGSLGGLMKMIPGVGTQMSASKITQAEQKLKVADSIIKSMTKKERSTPDLLFSSPSATSRLRRIAAGSGRTESDTKNLMSDFQRMRTMMARMSKQMLAGNAEMQGAPQMGATKNRAQRRRAAKKKATRGGGKRGFG